MNVTRITVGRLFNLGSYEHIRYELTVEVPAGESAATALTGVENILNALNPKRPHGVPSEADLESWKSSLKSTRDGTDEQVRRSYGMSKYGRIVQQQKAITEGEWKLAGWKARQTRARKLLEDIGGAANYKDAKQDWDDQEF